MTKIEIVGKFYDNHSLAIVNRELAIHLSETEEVYITPTDSFDWGHKISRDKIAKIKRLEAKQLKQAPDIQVRHCYPPDWSWPKSNRTKLVIIQPWEFVKVPTEWAYKFETFADAIITPSNWTASVYKQTGVNPNKIHVVPNGYDPEVFNNKEDVKSEKVRFVYVGCHQYRKGIDILLKAWVKAFNKFSKAELIIKDTPDIYGESRLLEEIVKTQYLSECAPIKYLDNNYTTEEMAELYKSADVLVHPYRGEGFGMHIQEAMACGAYPIVSKGGSTEDFVLDSECKIDVGQKIVDPFQIFMGKPGDSFTGMGSHGWMLEPNEDHLAALMKDAHENYKELQFDDSVIKNNTWENVAKEYGQVLRKVSGNTKETIRERLFA